MKHNYFNFFNKTLCLISLGLWGINTQAQVGDLLWSDEFDTIDTSVWTVVDGNGCEISTDLCGWGNQELQYYISDNVYIEEIDSSTGNNALVLEATDTGFGSNAFTSGKIESADKLTIQYGMIEVSIRIPDLNNGLWPAAWLLGASGDGWPANGELDMMEMGHQNAFMQSEGYWGGNNNVFVGSNVIWENSANGNVSMIATDPNYNTPYVASSAMNDRFVQYRMYWTDESIRYTVVDNGVEHDQYTSAFGISDTGDTSIFQAPFYYILNLAVGGNFTNETTNNSITALDDGSAKMYVDYLRVYEYNGLGTVNYDETGAETGVFGVYTETTATNNSAIIGVDANYNFWGDIGLTVGSEAPLEGEYVNSYITTPGATYGGFGVASMSALDMSNYIDNGSLVFKMKTEPGLDFSISISDTGVDPADYLDNIVASVAFTSGVEQYGYTGSGEWETIEIPFSAFTNVENVDFSNINDLFTFNVSNYPTEAIAFAIDDVVWLQDQTEVADAETGVFGVYTETTVTDNAITIGVDGNYYQWSANYAEGSQMPTEGDEVITQQVTSSGEWFGAGIVSNDDRNMSNYTENGSLKFDLNIASDVSFQIGFSDGTNNNLITFTAGEEQYGYTGSGDWEEIEIPIADFATTSNYETISYMFIILSVEDDLPTAPFEFSVDDVVWLEDQTVVGDAQTGTFGVFTETTTTDNALVIDDFSATINYWNNLTPGTETASEGDEVMTLATVAADTWFGGGITSNTTTNSINYNMSNFESDGILSFEMKTSSPEAFQIGISDGTNSDYITITSDGTYGYTGSGDWETVEIPLSEYTGINFESINAFFNFVNTDPAPSSTFNFAFDNIVWYETSTLSNNEFSVSNNTLSIYPIPAVDEITVALLDATLYSTISIVDLSGKEVINAPVNGTVTLVPVTGLPSGLYIVKVSGTSTDNFILSKIIIE